MARMITDLRVGTAATRALSLQNRAVFERAMRLQVLQVEPVQQPEELLLVELDDRHFRLPVSTGPR